MYQKLDLEAAKANLETCEIVSQQNSNNVGPNTVLRFDVHLEVLLKTPFLFVLLKKAKKNEADYKQQKDYC